MVVLGIDPGTETTGYGVLQKSPDGITASDYGAVRTSAKSPLGDRLAIIYDAIDDLLTTHQPGLMVVERLFFKKNVTSAMAVGHARGVILLKAAQVQVPVVEYTPPEIKVAITGYGGAAKSQMLFMIGRLLNISTEGMRDDTADALAAGLCGIFRDGH